MAKRDDSRGWLAVGVILPMLVVFSAAATFTHNVFYAGDAYLLDAGWLSALAYHNVPLVNPPLMGRPVRLFYGDHVAPIFSIASLLSYLTPLARVDWFCAFQGLLFAPLGAAPGLVVRPAQRRSTPQAALCALTGGLFAFGGVVFSCFGYPHFEVFIASGACVALAGAAGGSRPLFYLGIAMAASCREDGGLHVAVVLSAVYVCDCSGRRWPLPRKEILRGFALGILISVAFLAIQRFFDPRTGRIFRMVYSGDPAFAHVTWASLRDRVHVFVTAGRHLWLPFAATVALAVARRDPRFLLGWLVQAPWFVLNLLALQADRAAFGHYIGFPFIASLFWVLAYDTVRAHAAEAPPYRLREHALLAITSVISLAGLYSSYPAATVGLVSNSFSFRESDPAAIRSFMTKLRDEPGKWGYPLMDGTLASWTIESAIRLHVIDDNDPDSTIEQALAFRLNGYQHPASVRHIKASHLDVCGRIPHTHIVYCTKPGRELPPELVREEIPGVNAP